MTNEIVKTEANYFEKYGEAATQHNIVGRLLKFTKFGEFVAGQENEIIQIGTEFVAYMPAFSVGYVRWEDNRPAQFEMGYVGEGFVPPKRNDLGWNDSNQWERDDKGVPRDPWQFTNSLIFVEIDRRLLYTFNTSSKGGFNAMGRLSKIYGQHRRVSPSDDLPTVRLGVDSYKHSNKSYGEIRVPKFDVVTNKWVLIDDLPYLEGLPALTETRHVETTLKQDFAGDEIPF